MQEQANSLGEIFKARRSETNLSLKEVQNATSIRIAYLKGIEEGGIGQMISPIYAKGFVCQYAQFLGLNGDQMIKDYSALFDQSQNQEFSYGIGTLEVRGTPGGGVKWLPNLLWASGVVVVLVGAYYFAKSLGLF